MINKLFKRACLRKQGFTLIELLVVIAIIGILAAVILANLGNARQTARDGAVKSELANMRPQAELYANRHQSRYTAAVGTTAGPGCGPVVGTLLETQGTEPNTLSELITGVTNAGGTPTCYVAANFWVVSSTLPSGAPAWCVDSVGHSREATINATLNGCQ